MTGSRQVDGANRPWRLWRIYICGSRNRNGIPNVVSDRVVDTVEVLLRFRLYLSGEVDSGPRCRGDHARADARLVASRSRRQFALPTRLALAALVCTPLLKAQVHNETNQQQGWHQGQPNRHRREQAEPEDNENRTDKHQGGAAAALTQRGRRARGSTYRGAG